MTGILGANSPPALGSNSTEEIFPTLQDPGFDFTHSASQALQKGDKGVPLLCFQSLLFLCGAWGEEAVGEGEGNKTKTIQQYTMWQFFQPKVVENMKHYLFFKTSTKEHNCKRSIISFPFTWLLFFAHVYFLNVTSAAKSHILLLIYRN